MIEADGEPARLLQPEVTVEVPLQLGRLGPVAVEGGRVTGLLGEVGPGQVGAVDVGLDLAQGDGGLGHRAVGEADAVPGVLPALIDETAVGGPVVLHIAVAVHVAEALDPVEGPLGVREELLHRLAGQAPASQFAEEHDEQRGGVGRAVVDAPPAERERRRLAEAHLVQDPARLLVAAGIDVLALEAGQRLEDAEGEVGVDQQGHPGGDEGVPTEDGHEPGSSGGHDHPFGEVRIEDAQRPQVLGAAGEDVAQAFVIGFHLGHLAAPAGQALGRGGPVDRLAAEIAGIDGLALDDGMDLDARPSIRRGPGR